MCWLNGNRMILTVIVIVAVIILGGGNAKADFTFGEPTNLGPVVNSSKYDDKPCISADGLSLYFTSDREVGYGYEDIWVSTRPTTGDPWDPPRNLGSIVNTELGEFHVSVSNDELELYFERWDYGRFIMRTTKEDDWSSPVNPGSPINSSFKDRGGMISSDGLILYFPSDRPSGYGSYDLWQAPILPVVDFDDDGSVGMSDLLVMIDALDTDERLCDIGPMPWGDGVVDEADLEILMEHWGEFYPTIVDNFESYNDDWENPDGATIWNTWWDAFLVWDSGSIVGYDVPPFAETMIVHGGSQAMPFFYDNDGTLNEDYEDFETITGVPYYSQAQRTWAEPQDWTVKGVEVLTLWFYGEPDNSADPFYVALEDSAGNRKDVIHPDPAVLTVNDWQQWRIRLADFTDVDLTAVKIMYIGVGDPTRSQPGGSGLVRIDDIELHRSSGQ